MDANPSRHPQAAASGPLAVHVAEVAWPDQLRAVVPLRDLTAIAGWSWHGLEDPLFEVDLALEPRHRDAIALVAFVGDRPAGYCGLRLNGGTAKIVALVVDPDRRRRRVGYCLVAHALQRWTNRTLDGGWALEAFVRVDNVDGRAFFAALGFKGRRCRRAPFVRFTPVR